MTKSQYEFDDKAWATIRAWEDRVQATFIAPLPPPEDDDPNIPATSERLKDTRPNIVVSRVDANGKSASQACDEFLEQTAQAIAQLDVIEDVRNFVFQDDHEGICLEIRFPAGEGVKLRQTHAFRIDNDVLTQLVATYADNQLNPWRGTLEEALKGFVPL